MAAAVDAGAITVQWGEDEAQLHISDVIDTQGSVSEFADMLVADKVQYATWWSVGVSSLHFGAVRWYKRLCMQCLLYRNDKFEPLRQLFNRAQGMHAMSDTWS